ncbi:hypothetical protein JAAARDRAFT_174576 [Jaapia argillacea MUCL 33604]|uniref:O-methyltransferase C-terminal domain-containing protein n=1 Tax=Jaapia argillacea MUCL 33604 TaxID=933084 RepID=A0A067Q0I4_9AGAM|nr:hypothetical protein JAAARDRAFT_174576 [Jaapia argillacea MUCL 33604]
MSIPQSLSELTSLQASLNVAIEVFKAELAKQGLPEPSLCTSQAHPIDDISYIPTPAMYEARRLAMSSMSQIKYLIESPYDALASNTWMTLETASVRLVADIGLADILESAPDPEQGLSIEEIGGKTEVDPFKLERIMRLLVAQNWFREPKPGYFANNRRSNLIKDGQPGRHLATYMNQLWHKISEKLPDFINHPDKAFRFSTDASHTAFNLAMNTDLLYVGTNSWLTNHPGEAERFGLAMGAIGPTSDPGVVADFPWVAVASGKDTVVDVGGGQGTLCCSLAEKYPELKSFVVRDVPETRVAAESFIESKGLSDRIKFEVQDFFTPQQRKGKYVFVIQRVLHDWSTQEGAKILEHLRDVLNDGSSLLIIDTIIHSGVLSPSGRDASESLSQLHDHTYSPVSPPPFIPIDFGDASRINHQIDVALVAQCNSFERTLPQLQEMVELSGLRIKKVHATRGWASITEVVRV